MHHVLVSRDAWASSAARSLSLPRRVPHPPRTCVYDGIKWNATEISHEKPFPIHPGEVTADTSLRLGAYFGLPAQFWMNLQTNYDLRLADSNQDLKKTKPRNAAA